MKRANPEYVESYTAGRGNSVRGSPPAPRYALWAPGFSLCPKAAQPRLRPILFPVAHSRPDMFLLEDHLPVMGCSRTPGELVPPVACNARTTPLWQLLSHVAAPECVPAKHTIPMPATRQSARFGQSHPAWGCMPAPGAGTRGGEHRAQQRERVVRRRSRRTFAGIVQRS